MRTPAALTTVLALAAVAPGQTLVKDINTLPVAAAQGASPRPAAVAQNGNLLLTALTAPTGFELWSTDGTGAGTELLLDIWPGPDSSLPASFATLPSGIVLFRARTPQHGAELWRTDGTAAGTWQVADIHPGPSGSMPTHLLVVGNEVVFRADDGVHGMEPWRSDGTAAGTTMLVDTTPGPIPSTPLSNFARLGGTRVAFTTRNAGHQLWTADLSNGTATLVQAFGIAAGPTPVQLHELGSRVVFTLPTPNLLQPMWATDGTAAGTVALGADFGDRFVTVGPNGFFRAADTELWRTDGTPAGTSLAVDVTPTVGSNSFVKVLGALGNEVLFVGTRHFTQQLYAFDAGSGTTRAIRPLSMPLSYESLRVGGRLFFTGGVLAAPTLMCTDGTALGTQTLGFVGPESLHEFRGEAWFGGSDPTVGDELWHSDGTPAGTRLAADIVRGHRTQGSFPNFFGTLGRDALFVGFDGIAQRIWRSDGTPGGTQPFAAPKQLLNETPLFASTGTFALVVSRHVGGSTSAWIHRPGSPALQQVRHAAPGFDIEPIQPAALADRIVFAASTPLEGAEPWITDGTAAGTMRIRDLMPGPQPAAVYDFVSWRGRVWFRGQDPAVGPEPWSTDGTAAGTTPLVEVRPGPAGALRIDWAPTDARLFFRTVSTPNVIELWSTDGTSAGTSALDLTALGLDDVTQMTSLGDRLLFASSDGNQQRAVVTDGTGAGTVLLPATIAPSRIARIGDGRAVILVDAGLGEDIWLTDGTAAGTTYGGFAPGRLWTADRRWQVTDDRWLLAREDAVRGNELHASDGTFAGTRMLFDLAPAGSLPQGVARVGDFVLLSADDGEHGTELFRFDVALLQDEVVEPFGFGCAGAGARPPTLRVDGEADASAGSFDLVVDGALSNTPVLFAVSDVDGTTALGGCTVWLGGTPTVVATTSNAAGRAAVTLPVTPALFGLRFVAQGFAIEPNGPLFGLATASRGLEVVLGP